jgi:hypothetical protein
MFKAAFAADGMPELDTEPSSPAGQLVDALTAEAEAMHAALLFLAGMFNPYTSEGRWQDALGNIYFLARKNSEPTTVACRLTGLPGTRIPYGAQAEDAKKRKYANTRETRIDASGEAVSVFRCLTRGPESVGAGEVNRIITTVPGWDTILNGAPGITGRNLETRGDFESRRHASVAKNAHGTVPSIYGALHDLSGTAGVIDVQVLENIGPDPVVKFGVTVPGHGVTVCIFGGEDADIARILYSKKDAGCDTGGNTEVIHTVEGGGSYVYRILRPAAVPFWVKVRLGPGEDIGAESAGRIRKAVLDDFNGLGRHPRLGLASEVYASRFYIPVLDTGVSDLTDITIALGPAPEGFADRVSVRGDQEPALALDSVLVERA